LEDGRIRCDLCPRGCTLRDGQAGLCLVRARQGDGLVLRTYGRSSGFCMDPIEKKPLNHFLPGTATLSFGTAGCNLSCRFCQNWDLSHSREVETLSDEASPETLAQAAHAMGCASVAYTYNDPVVFHEYAVDVARACHDKGLKNVAVTNGYVCAGPRAEFYAVMDAANVDLKSFSESFYRTHCGGHLEPVLETLRYVKRETRCWLEITTLLIPGENDSEAELDQLTSWVVAELGPDVPLHFSAFHPDHKMTDLPPTPPATLRRARAMALKNGVRHAFTGNVHDEDGASTSCHGCGLRLIGRDWFQVTEWNLGPGGTCRRCGTVCAGVFQDLPGTWGARRQPVRIRDDGRRR
jgi:pyruvate formate lyase activating enzyme